MIKKITKVEKQKKNNKRYSIFINGEFAFGVHEDILVKYELLKGKELDDTFVYEVIKAKEQNKADNYGLKLLSYRARSEKEIKDKMIEKGYDEDIISNTIRNLKKSGYINDRHFARSFVINKSKIKKYGVKRIQIELLQKGVDREIIDELIEELMDNNDELEKAMELAKKKLVSSYSKDEKRVQYTKIGGYLQRRGYDMNTITKVLQELVMKD